MRGTEVIQCSKQYGKIGWPLPSLLLLTFSPPWFKKLLVPHNFSLLCRRPSEVKKEEVKVPKSELRIFAKKYFATRAPPPWAAPTPVSPCRRAANAAAGNAAPTITYWQMPTCVTDTCAVGAIACMQRMQVWRVRVRWLAGARKQKAKDPPVGADFFLINK